MYVTWHWCTYTCVSIDYRGETGPTGWPAVSSHYGVFDNGGFPKVGTHYYNAWWRDFDVGDESSYGVSISPVRESARTLCRYYRSHCIRYLSCIYRFSLDVSCLCRMIGPRPFQSGRQSKSASPVPHTAPRCFSTAWRSHRHLHRLIRLTCINRSSSSKI